MDNQIEFLIKKVVFFLMFYLLRKQQPMFIYFIYMVLINLACILIGTILTQNKKIALPILSKKLDKKPFNCRPCLTFHLLWISYAIAALIIQSWTFFIVGLVFSFAIFAFLYFDDQSKITK